MTEFLPENNYFAPEGIAERQHQWSSPGLNKSPRRRVLRIIDLMVLGGGGLVRGSGGQGRNIEHFSNLNHLTEVCHTGSFYCSTDYRFASIDSNLLFIGLNIWETQSIRRNVYCIKYHRLAKAYHKVSRLIV